MESGLSGRFSINRRVAFAMLPVVVISISICEAMRIETVLKRNINCHAVEDLQKGMSLAEVEAILKCPPGDYTGGIVRPVFWKTWVRGERVLVWKSNDGFIYVGFDREGRLHDKLFVDVFMDDGTIVDVLWFRFFGETLSRPAPLPCDNIKPE
jgi:hypothetical protein